MTVNLTALYLPEPRGNTQREDRNSRGNNAMGNAFADALKKLEKITSYGAKLFALFLYLSFPEKHRQNGDFLL